MPFGPFSPTQADSEAEARAGARIKVIGVGGGGNNAVNRMIDAGMKGVEFIAANTDLQPLQTSKAPVTLQLGARISRGLGSGGDPEIARRAAIEDADDIITALDGADMVFITAGLGGGTGTGAAPIIASLASRMGALTVAVVTRPFAFEGRRRMAQAQRGLEELLAVVDTLIIIPNEKLLSVAHDAGFFDSFEIADDVLRQAVQGIADIVTLPGLINRDFADVRATIAGMGYAVMGTASRSGTARATKAAMAAIASPLLDDAGINGARAILMHVSGSSSLKLAEVNEAATIIQRAAHEDANILFGTVLDEELGDRIKITVIAAGFADPRLPREVNHARDSMPEQAWPQPSAPELPYRRVPEPIAKPIPEPSRQPISQSIRREVWASEPAHSAPAPEPVRQARPAPEPMRQTRPAPEPVPQVVEALEPSRQAEAAPDPVLNAAARYSMAEFEEATASLPIIETVTAPSRYAQPPVTETIPPAPAAAAPAQAPPAPAAATARPADAAPILASARQTAIAAYAAIAMPDPEADGMDEEEEPLELEPLGFAALLEARRRRLESMDPGPVAGPVAEEAAPEAERYREPDGPEQFQETAPPWLSEIFTQTYTTQTYTEDDPDDESASESIIDTHSLSYAEEDSRREPAPEETGPDPVRADSVVEDPVLDELVLEEPVPDEPIIIDPVLDEPVFVEPAATATTATALPGMMSSMTSGMMSGMMSSVTAGATETAAPAANLTSVSRAPEDRPLPLWSARGLAWARSLDSNSLDFNDRLGRQADVGPSGETHRNGETPVSVPSFAGVHDSEGGLAELDELDIPAFLRRDERF